MSVPVHCFGMTPKVRGLQKESKRRCRKNGTPRVDLGSQGNPRRPSTFVAPSLFAVHLGADRPFIWNRKLPPHSSLARSKG
jgi:hypothetical protein